MSSNLARERLVSMCLGPSWVAVMKGRLMLVWDRVLSSILAFSAASVSLCRACRASTGSAPGVWCRAGEAGPEPSGSWSLIGKTYQDYAASLWQPWRSMQRLAVYHRALAAMQAAC